MKIKLIVPCNNQSDVKPQVMEFLRELNRLRPDICVMLSKNALVSRSRNVGVFGRYVDLKYPRDLLEYDVYAFLDSDVLPQVGDYITTLEKMDRTVMYTGLYLIRDAETYAAGFIQGSRITSLTKDEVMKTQAVEWAGGGLLFVGADVLAKIAYPYFHEGVASWTDVSGVERSVIIGEDVMFCIKVCNSGSLIRVAHNLVAEHLTSKEI